MVFGRARTEKETVLANHKGPSRPNRSRRSKAKKTNPVPIFRTPITLSSYLPKQWGQPKEDSPDTSAKKMNEADALRIRDCNTPSVRCPWVEEETLLLFLSTETCMFRSRKRPKKVTILHLTRRNRAKGDKRAIPPRIQSPKKTEDVHNSEETEVGLS